MLKRMNEKTIEKKLAREIGRRGGKALKFTSPYMTGMPDRLIIMPGGKAYWAELKTTGKKAGPRQLERQKELRDLGFVSEIVSSETELEEFLKIIDDGQD